MSYLLSLVRHVSLLFWLFAFASCIYEDLSDCPPPAAPEVESYIRFSYVPYSAETGEGFDARELQRITVFAFDSLGRYVAGVTDETPRLGEADYRLALSLLPGRYDFYAWGNVRDCYAFTCTEFVPRETDLRTTGLNYLRPANDTVRVSPHPLFFASAQQVVIGAPSTRTSVSASNVDLHLVKDTYTLTIRLSGLTADHRLEAVVTDNNSSFRFDNAFTDCRYLNYCTPLDWQEEVRQHGGSLTTLRLDRERSPLFKLYNRATGKALYHEDLIDLLLASEKASGKPIDFSRQYDFTLDLVFSEEEETGKVSLSIRVNGWQVVEQQVVIDLSKPNLPF